MSAALLQEKEGESLSREDKPEVVETETVSTPRHGNLTTREEVERIDALAVAHGTSSNSFAHLDEAKILRKVC